MERKEYSLELMERKRAITELEQFLEAIANPGLGHCHACQRPGKIEASSSRHWHCPESAENTTSPYTKPVVTALSSLGLIQPCWSTDGRTDSRGYLREPPQVGFFTTSHRYVHILHQHVDMLFHTSKLNAAWQVARIRIRPDWGPTHVIQPAINLGLGMQLEQLREDIQQVGENLLDRLKLIAECRLAIVRKEANSLSAFYGQRL